jgi:hypothetical protein
MKIWLKFTSYLIGFLDGEFNFAVEFLTFMNANLKEKEDENDTRNSYKI